MTVNIVNFLQDHLVFLLCLYTVTIVSFFIIRKYLTVFHIIFLYSFILFIMFIFLIFLFNHIVLQNNFIHINLVNNNTLIGIIDSTVTLSLNYLSYFFFLLVTIIGCATNIYVLNYFRGEADEGKFVFWLNSFIVSMIMFVLSNNFYTLFFGWEMIGLTSFFLINFWNGRKATLKASMKAFTFNLVSDIFFLMALICFYLVTGTTDCDVFIYLILWEGIEQTNYLDMGVIALTICSGIKSVQIIGHLWLPDSMEAPVPASALIHSATLVSAGIYLICKFNIVYIYFGHVKFFSLIGALTAAYGGVVAAAQTDMKKLLAYSTMSHSGFLWILAVNGYFEVTVLYLFLHGLFKAATFYCAGSFIRFYGTQDTRFMGNGGSYLLGDSALLILSSVNLAGLPFTIGVAYKSFFFKILLGENFDYLTLGLIFIGLLTGIVYFFRLVYYSVFDFYKGVNSCPSIILSNSAYLTHGFLKVVKFNHVLAVFLLIGFSVIVSIVGQWAIQNNVLGLFNSNNFVMYMLDDEVINSLYQSYFIYFYSLYLFVFLSLIIFSWRKNYFIFYTNTLMVYIFVGLCFIF